MSFVLVVSDLHVGGAFGLMPPDFVSSTDVTVSLNEAQLYLWECWTHIADSVPAEIDLLIVNGDATEGQNRAEECRMLSEVDPTYQARAAAHALRPLTSRAKRILMTRGSTYHVGRGAWMEEMVGDMIGAEPRKNRRAQTWIRDEIDGVYLDVAHRQTATIRYKSMPMEREMSFYLERIARKKQVRPDKVLIVRSHTHAGYRMYEERGIMSVSTPCMKVQDDFASMTISPNRIIPDNLGVLGFQTDDCDNDTVVRVVKYLYDHPE